MAEPPPAGPREAPAERVIWQEDFREFAASGVPAGWEFWSPSAKHVLRVAAGGEGGGVEMSGQGAAHAKGSLRRRLPAMQADRHYRFEVRYRTQGISHPHNTVYAFVSWGDQRRFQLLAPKREENGWTVAELVLRPAAGSRALPSLELFAGWIPAGSVRWGGVRMTELARYEAPRRPVAVAVIDSRPPRTGDLLANADFYAAEIARARAVRPLDVVVLPEHFNTTQVAGDSEVTLDSEYLRRLGAAARAQRVNVLGSVILREGDLLHNTALLIDRQGRVAGKYHKTHLATPEALFTPLTRGEALEPIDTDFGRIGVLVCWDYHFPEAVRTLIQKGAEMLFVPLAGDGRLIEDGISMGIEYSGKAIVLDNRVPIVFAVTYGSTRNPSMIIDSLARVVAKSSDARHIISGEVDLAAQVIQWTGSDFRALYRADRRPELYGPLGGSEMP